MGYQKPTVNLGWLAWLAMASLFLLGGCSPSTPQPEDVGEARAAVFVNGGFESGAAGTVPAAPWVLADNLNPNAGAPNDGVTIQNPQTLAGLNLAPGGKNLTSILVSAGGPLSQVDADMGASATLRWPRYGNGCAKINAHSSTAYTTAGTKNGRNVNTLSQTMVVAAGDVDPTDHQVHIRFVVAPVLEDPGHPANEQPYFFVQVTNLTRANAVLYSNFNFSNQAGVPWQTCTNANCVGVPAGTTYRYTNWQLIDVAPGGTAINLGDTVELQLIAAGCSPGGHEGELYVDGLGATLPGLFISGTGPAQANPGTDITYQLNYKNGSAGAETGAVIDFTTPPNTTFQSLTPPAGATCTTPAVGTAGTIVCTFTGPIPAGGTGGMTVTVAVAATAPAGLLACGNYQIGSTQETPLLGNIINTEIGCSADDQCPAGRWCDETLAVCTPTLANGVAIPVDGTHTNFGLCNAATGALVCTSGVCDSDNKCGYLNGDGPCAAGTPAAVCRSNVCDADMKCGYAANDGPCVPGALGNGGVVCRSGLTCSSSSGVCEPAGGCDVDADCTAGNWCFESKHQCTPTLANGVAIPNDGTHTDNGACDAASGALVCTSQICDPSNNECGYANGDGPCTVLTGPAVCQSGICSAHGTVCVPLVDGCSVDADCIAADFCNTVSDTCVPKLPNGTPVPTVGNHTPVLDGTCTTGAGAAVCVSGVCDPTDNACGYANGDGTCTPGTPAVVCRSNVCDPDMRCGYAANDGPCVPGVAGNGTIVCRAGLACSAVSGVCEPAGGCDVDADCAAGFWCFESMHTCTATLPNGAPIPNDGTHTDGGTCDAASGLIVCTSTVCDPSNNECGYAIGDGPCTPGTGPQLCQSGTCSAHGTVCVPASNGCAVDADCTSANWCDETTHLCTPKLVNGTPIPTDPTSGSMPGSHLDGTCTVASGAIVCVSGICDPKDNECGLAPGDGICTGNPGACRTGTCSATGVCGCAVDTDCALGNWCFETTATCTPQVANGGPIPNDGTHTDNGMCDPASGLIVCQSGVCDTHDQDCGYAVGDGPCTPSATSTVCRSGVCGASGVCIASSGCAADIDCPTGKWCDVNATNPSLNACVAQLPNGMVVPTDPGHTSPTLTGTCTPAAGLDTCQSGVCDTKDNECGYANGDGPCSDNGATVCRSGICATTGANTGLCEACVMDSQCPATAPHCNPTTNTCIQCVSSAQCSGSKPICDPTSSTCVACSGDQGSGTPDACPAGSPFCFLSGSTAGQCGKCATNADCQGHAGNVCDTTSGVCVTGCLADTDCPSNDWCNGTPPATGMCVPKLPNGTALPSTPPSVATCTAAVGTRVCVSGVCDAKDNTCGYANGDGPCANANQCRSDNCMVTSMTCQPSGSCSGDGDCSTADFCSSSGACTPKLPSGASCTGADQCQSGACDEGACDGVVASGNGIICAASSAPRSSDGNPVAIFGLALAAAGLSRRRRR